MKLNPSMTKKTFWKEVTKEIMKIFKKHPGLKKLVTPEEFKHQLKIMEVK